MPTIVRGAEAGGADAEVGESAVSVGRSENQGIASSQHRQVDADADRNGAAVLGVRESCSETGPVSEDDVASGSGEPHRTAEPNPRCQRTSVDNHVREALASRQRRPRTGRPRSRTKLRRSSRLRARAWPRSRCRTRRCRPTGSRRERRRSAACPVTGREVAVREERSDATSGEATELDECLSDVRGRGDRAEAAEAHDAPSSVWFTAAGVVSADAAGDLEADEGAEQAVSRCRASVELDTATSAEADGILRRGRAAQRRGIGANTAADAEAGFGAGDVEEACAVGGANANVLDRSSLLRREDRQPEPRQRRRDPRPFRGRRLLTSFMVDLQSFETLGGRVFVLR